MGNNQSSGSGSGSSGSGTRDWEYTPRNGGDGTASDAAWQGAKQGFKEFFQSPSKETRYLDHHLRLTMHL